MKKSNIEVSTVKGLEHNIEKAHVRSDIVNQVFEALPQLDAEISFLSLPATEWSFEKELLATLPSKKIKHIVGMETNKKRFIESQNNIPQTACNINLFRGDLDSFIHKYSKAFNIIWADYCSNPAVYDKTKTNKYSYPRFHLFLDAVRNSKKPFMYYLTFSCTGRAVGGQDEMKAAMGPNNKSLYSASYTKMIQMINSAGLSDRVHPIMKISYLGGKLGRTPMITMGFAVNFVPNFPKISEDRIKAVQDIRQAQKLVDKAAKKAAKKALKAKKEPQVDLASERSRLIRLMADNGFDNLTISQLLKLSRNQVGSVMAHKNHGESFKKGKGKKETFQILNVNN